MVKRFHRSFNVTFIWQQQQQQQQQKKPDEKKKSEICSIKPRDIKVPIKETPKYTVWSVVFGERGGSSWPGTGVRKNEQISLVFREWKTVSPSQRLLDTRLGLFINWTISELFWRKWLMRNVTFAKTGNSQDEREWEHTLMIIGCVQFICYGNASNKHAWGGQHKTRGV